MCTFFRLLMVQVENLAGSHLKKQRSLQMWFASMASRRLMSCTAVVGIRGDWRLAWCTSLAEVISLFHYQDWQLTESLMAVFNFMNMTVICSSIKYDPEALRWSIICSEIKTEVLNSNTIMSENPLMNILVIWEMCTVHILQQFCKKVVSSVYRKEKTACLHLSRTPQAERLTQFVSLKQI